MRLLIGKDLSPFIAGMRMGVIDLGFLAIVATCFLLWKRDGGGREFELGLQPVFSDVRHLPYGELIDSYARASGIEPVILASIVTVESRFDPNAVSYAGAEGLGQLMPAIQRAYGVTNPFDPAQNLSGAARHLSVLVTKYDEDIELAIAAYHAGEPTIDACRCISRPIDEEYVDRWRKAMESYSLSIRVESKPVQASVLRSVSKIDETQFVMPYRSGYVVTSWNCHPGGWGAAGYGVDISNGPTGGTPLYAPISGIVQYVGYDGYADYEGADGRGNTVIHIVNGRWQVALLHGVYSEVRVGDTVIAGVTHIGYEDTIGNSTGVHTHLSVSKNGVAVNPLKNFAPCF